MVIILDCVLQQLTANGASGVNGHNATRLAALVKSGPRFFNLVKIAFPFFKSSPIAFLLYLCCLLPDFVQILHEGSLLVTRKVLLHGLYNQKPNKGRSGL